MDPQRPMVRVEPGSGVVIRLGPAVVLLAATAGADSFEGELRKALAPWVAADAVAPGEAVRALAKLLITHRSTAPALGAAVQVDDSFRLLLHGAVRAVISGSTGDLVLSGLTAATWVDQLVTAPTGAIRITLMNIGNAPVGAVHSGGGQKLVTDRAPGGTLILWPHRTDPIVSLPTSRQPHQAQPRAGGLPGVALLSGVDDVPPPASWPRLRAVETKVVDDPVAALVADDGTRTLLDRNYVFGREPQRDSTVARGEASPVTVADPDNLISRVQAFVSVVAGDVLVRDNSSTNGTFIAEPDAKEWQRLGTATAVLPPDWSLRMGRRVFTYREAGF